VGPVDDGVAEAREALLTLGYTRAEAAIALNQSAGETMPVEARIAAALRELGSRDY
jgi:Holliday junction resolvasome RuvABC DNA-binding subunit